MKNLVACTLTSAVTNLSCVIRIGFSVQRKNPWQRHFWEKIGGRLEFAHPNITFTSGSWEATSVLTDWDSMKHDGVVDLMTQGKSFENRKQVAKLDQFPWMLIFRATPPGEISRGEGILYLTNEKLTWSMWRKPFD